MRYQIKHQSIIKSTCQGLPNSFNASVRAASAFSHVSISPRNFSGLYNTNTKTIIAQHNKFEFPIPQNCMHRPQQIVHSIIKRAGLTTTESYRISKKESIIMDNNKSNNKRDKKTYSRSKKVYHIDKTSCYLMA